MSGRTHATALILVALAGLIGGCQGDETPEPKVKRIIILTNGNSPFWDAAASGAEKAAKDLKLKDANLVLEFQRGDFGVSPQVDKLKNYTNATDVAAVGISVTDANSPAIADEMQTLKNAGIKVITIDSDVDRQNYRDARFAYIGTDNIVAGRELGKASRAIAAEGGEYATFVGIKGADNAKERIRGFGEGAGDAFTQKENMGDGGDRSTARSNVRDALDRNPDINVLVGIWSYNTPAIVDIVEELGNREQVKIFGFDAEPPAIKAMDEGMLDVMVVQNPYQMGYQGVRLMKAMVEEDQAAIDEMLPDRSSPNGDLYSTGLKVIVPNNEERLTPDLFEPTTELLTLDQFQAWLKKYKLTGS